MRIALAILILSGLAATAEARPRTARCVLTAPQTTPYRGPCKFLAEAGGSFSISPVGRRFLVDGVDLVSVTIVRPGVAEVRGLTSDGINSRWGEARRSRRDRACWDGGDFRICVY
ncbi:MAG: hypothetical protein ACJ8ER_09290 [Allosphingosinicella sp.]